MVHARIDTMVGCLFASQSHKLKLKPSQNLVLLGLITQPCSAFFSYIIYSVTGQLTCLVWVSVHAACMLVAACWWLGCCPGGHCSAAAPHCMLYAVAQRYWGANTLGYNRWFPAWWPAGFSWGVMDGFQSFNGSCLHVSPQSVPHLHWNMGMGAF